MKILIDTREKLMLWNPENKEVEVTKLDEGDYTTEDLLEKAHIERKSPIDFYGSIVQNHDRFMREIQRAIEKDLRFAVFIECEYEDFVKKKFSGAYRLKIPAKTLKKIVDTLDERYPIEFVWCADRIDMRRKMLIWFEKQREEIYGETTTGSQKG
jgi:ERCC4-type nuclease